MNAGLAGSSVALIPNIGIRAARSESDDEASR